jgi:hypothetical protein
MSIKLITATWGHSDGTEVNDHILVKSFQRYNPNIDIHHIHFNRGKFFNLEQEFSTTYGYQFEFLLYKIFLLKDKIEEIETDYLLLCDTTDVLCISSIQHLIDIFDLKNNIVFGTEKNQWPTPPVKNTWKNYFDYKQFNLTHKYFLNAGCILSKKDIFLDLLNKCIKLMPSLEFLKNSTHQSPSGGDQGLYTWMYNMVPDSNITLDYKSKFVVNTYSRSTEEYEINKGRFCNKETKIAPCFVHDNGWNYGSLRYREYFQLTKIYHLDI